MQSGMINTCIPTTHTTIRIDRPHHSVRLTRCSRRVIIRMAHINQRVNMLVARCTTVIRRDTRPYVRVLMSVKMANKLNARSMWVCFIIHCSLNAGFATSVHKRNACMWCGYETNCRYAIKSNGIATYHRTHNTLRRG